MLPPGVARERIARRSASIYNPSDATPELVDHMLARFDPWPEARDISTNRAIAESLDEAVDAVHGRPSNTSHHERRFFIDAPVSIQDDHLIMTHEGPAPVAPAMGTFAPAGQTTAP